MIAINDERYGGRIRPETYMSQQVFAKIREIIEIERTVYPLITKDLIPFAARDLCILNAQHKETLVSRVCQYEACPFLCEMCVSALVWLLTVWWV